MNSMGFVIHSGMGFVVYSMVFVVYSMVFVAYSYCVRSILVWCSWYNLVPLGPVVMAFLPSPATRVFPRVVSCSL